MKLITQRMLIQQVAMRWRKQYEPFENESPLFSERNGFKREMTKREIAEALDALDGNAATAQEVANIIGNDSWTKLECKECGESKEEVVECGAEPDYESATTRLCIGCARKVVRLLEA